MYAEVVVLTYQAPDIGTFTYEIPKNLEEKIKIGQLVQVPFGKRNPQAIVLDTRSDLEISTRSDLNVGKIKSINSTIIEQPLLLPYQIELLKWMASYYFAPMVNCLEAMIPPIPKKPSPIESSLARPRLARLEETIVLIPNLNRLPETLTQFPRAKNYVLYHNQLKTTERFANWLKILDEI